jgi:tetratricopeptide (TPR) repeat protein
LIDINKKLDLPEAALGVLKTARIELENQGAQSVVLTQNHVRTNSRDLKSLAYSVLSTSSEANKKDQNSWAGNVMYESWLTKLGSWAEALNMYETKLVENPSDVNSILGCMHCYDARGDWQRALNLAEMSWGAISDEQQFALEHTQLTHSNVLENRQRALKLCAQASWRLGRWDLLESYTSQLVEGYEDHSKLHSAKSRVNNETDIDFDSYFYRSVLHVHRAEWDKAGMYYDTELCSSPFEFHR